MNTKSDHNDEPQNMCDIKLDSIPNLVKFAMYAQEIASILEMSTDELAHIIKQMPCVIKRDIYIRDGESIINKLCKYPISVSLNIHNNQPCMRTYSVVITGFHGFHLMQHIANILAGYNKSEPRSMFHALNNLPAVLLSKLPLEQCQSCVAELTADGINAELHPDHEVKLWNCFPNHDQGISMNRNVLRCPKCGSTSVATGQRGFSVLTGFIGSGQTVNRCAKCGHRWMPTRNK